MIFQNITGELVYKILHMTPDDVLQPRERKMLEMRFYGKSKMTLNRYNYSSVTHVGMTLEEVGQEFGVTRERIRQIESKAIEKIIQYISNKLGDA